MQYNYLIKPIKLLLFILFISYIGDISKELLSTEVIKCNNLNVTNTDIYIQNVDKVDNVLSVFYLCNNKDISQAYVIESVFKNSPNQKNFIIYKNIFGKTSSYYTNFVSSFVSYIIFGPIIFSVIKDVWTIASN